MLKRFAFAAFMFAAGGGLSMGQPAPMPSEMTHGGHAATPPSVLEQPAAQQPMAASAACLDNCYSPPWHSRWFAGAEYRLIRPHFSEAVAFASVVDSIGPTGFNRRVTANELDFDYESSMRLLLGYHINECSDLRLSYWHLDVETLVDGVAGPGQTIVDPFGNLGLAGSEIDTSASVQLNVFDLEYLRPLGTQCGNVGFLYTAGVRFADVSQFYDSTISAAGAVTSNGVFEVDYFGVGPYLSLTGETRHGACRQFSFFAKGAMALLVGQYDVTTDVTLPGVTGGQAADRVRTAPVLESELGMAWMPTDRVRLTAGWLFQAWFNLGTSGGTFDGERLPIAPVDTAFGGADDSDIMSFDGLFLRAEIGY